MYNKYGIDQYEHDGVNSVEYAIHSVSNKSLYTWIYASIGELYVYSNGFLHARKYKKKFEFVTI